MKCLFCLPAVFLLAACAGGGSTTAERAWEKHDERLQRTPASEDSVFDITHTCVPKEGPACRSKIEWHCPSGYVDGCNTLGSTGKHICVEVRDGPANCAKEIALRCPAGFQD